MRRIRSGTWYRPTSVTVATREAIPPSDFSLLVAAAHGWPWGGVSGESLRVACGLAKASGPLEVAVPHSRSGTRDPTVILRRRLDLPLGYVRLESGRRIPIDLSAASLREAADELKPEDLAWLLVKTCGPLAPARRCERLHALSGVRQAWGQAQRTLVRELGLAVCAGAESAGEVYVWHLLTRLRVSFTAQRTLAVEPDRSCIVGTSKIRTDFLLEGGVCLEVDSGLHDHVRDVRRDLCNLEVGRRTVRLVGLDAIDHPALMYEQLRRALPRLGVEIRPTPLPWWLQAA